jgi:hypothetical protein
MHTVLGAEEGGGEAVRKGAVEQAGGVGGVEERDGGGEERTEEGGREDVCQM